MMFLLEIGLYSTNGMVFSASAEQPSGMILSASVEWIIR